MTTRRETIRLSAGADAQAVGYGVQLYGVREQAERDLANLLQALRQIGFTRIELHGIVYDHPAVTLRHMIEDAGLHAPSGHFPLEKMEASLEYAHALGLEYMVAMLRPKPLALADYRALADRLNEAGRKVAGRGMTFALLFHNHELLPQDGTSGFAELMKHTDPSLVSLEADVYWIAQAGLDPADFLRLHQDRVKLLHLKDRLPGFANSYTTDAASDHSTELGKGTIDWPALLRQAAQQKIPYAFLDYDQSSLPILDSLGQSYTYLNTLRNGS